jgi:hypothetical protein
LDSTIYLPYSTYLSFDLEVDYRVARDYTHSLFISTESNANNIVEYLVLPGESPQLVGYYTVPIKMSYSGNPP